MSIKLLISPMNLDEVTTAVDGGADIIDIKKPDEGSLGANFPWIIRSAKEMVPDGTPVSAAIGDFDFKPGTAALAATGAAAAGADYIKIGLFNIHSTGEARELLGGVVHAVKDTNKKALVVAAAYSDFERIHTISPLKLPGIASDVGADVVMVDTGIKDGRSTFEFMGRDMLQSFISDARDYELDCALAGSLGGEHIPLVKSLAPDILGIRSAVCENGRNSPISISLVRELKARLQ